MITDDGFIVLPTYALEHSTQIYVVVPGQKREAAARKAGETAIRPDRGESLRLHRKDHPRYYFEIVREKK